MGIETDIENTKIWSRYLVLRLMKDDISRGGQHPLYQKLGPKMRQKIQREFDEAENRILYEIDDYWQLEGKKF